MPLASTERETDEDADGAAWIVVMVMVMVERMLKTAATTMKSKNEACLKEIIFFVSKIKRMRKKEEEKEGYFFGFCRGGKEGEKKI